jgi:hypothetical protein
MEHASIFDDTLRREIREILSTRISDLEWARLKKRAWKKFRFLKKPAFGVGATSVE